MQQFMITVDPPTPNNSFLPASPSWDVTKIFFSYQVNPSGSAKSSPAFFRLASFSIFAKSKECNLKRLGTSFLPQLTPFSQCQKTVKGSYHFETGPQIIT